MAASVTHFGVSRCLRTASWQMRKRASACKMDSMQLLAVKGASPKRPFPVGASTVRRCLWGGPRKRAFVLPALKRCKAFPRRDAFRRTASFSANGATQQILARGGYSPPEPARQGGFHEVHGKQGSMPEVAGTEQTCFGGNSLPSSPMKHPSPPGHILQTAQ
jgi:hypothetical protein